MQNIIKNGCGIAPMGQITQVAVHVELTRFSEFAMATPWQCHGHANNRLSVGNKRLLVTNNRAYALIKTRINKSIR